MLAAFALSQLAALPDALLALWLMLLGNGVLEHRPGLVRAAGDRARRVRHGDLVPAHGQHPRAAPLPRQGDDRARVARRAAAGVGRDDRAPGAARVSRSPRDAARPGVRARSHVHVAVLDVRLDPAPRRDDRAAGVDPLRRSRCSPCSRCRPCSPRRGGRPSSARAQERGAQANRLARHLFTIATTAPPGKEVRVTGIGDRLVGRAPRGVGARVRADRRRALGIGGVAHARLGDLRRARTSARSSSSPAGFARRPATCCWCSPPARGCPPTSAPRSARSDFCAASGWTAHGVSPGSRTTRPRSRRSADQPAPTRLRDGIRFEHVSFAYPGTVASRARRCVVVAAGGRGRRHRRRERRRQDDARQAARQDVRADVRRDSRRRRAARAHRRRRVARRGWPARSRISSGSSSSRATPSVSAMCRGSTTSRPWQRQSSAPGRRTSSSALRSGLETQLGPTWPGGVDVSFGQWQKLALARGFMRDDPLLLVLDEPTAALDAETEHALFERYAAAAHDDRARRLRPHHDPRVAPLLDGAHGRSDRRARRRAARRGRHATRS